MARQRATLLEQAFVDHLTTPGDPAFGNATEAVVAAGYKPKSRAHAANMAYRLKVRPAVEALLAERRKAVREELRERALRVVEETYRGATFDPKDMLDEYGNPLPLDKVPVHARRALTSVKIETRDRVVRADDGDRVIREPVIAEYKTDKSGDKERFLRWAGELKETLKVEGGLTFEQIVLAADRKFREQAQKE